MNDLGLAYYINLLKNLASNATDKKLELAFMGYPDIVVTPNGYEGLLTKEAYESLEDRPNSENIKIIHKGKKRAGTIHIVPTLSSLTEAILKDFDVEASYTIFDFQTYEGTETIHDFNEPIDRKFYNKYHLLWNGGTLEHIFDIACALKNMTLVTKEGGFLAHLGPLNMVNHGFVNLCPVLFDNFYAVNNGTIIRCEVSPLSDTHQTHIIDDANKRVQILPNKECTLNVLVQKNKHKDKLETPIQGRYTQTSPWV